MSIRLQQGRENRPPAEHAHAGDPLACMDSEAELRGPLEQLLGAVVALCGASAASVRVLEDDTHQLRLVGAVGIPASLWECSRSVADSCGVCGDTIDSDDARWSPAACDCVREIRKCAGAGQGHRHRVFAVPLHYRGGACGVLNLFLPDEREPPAALSPLLAALGNMLGLSLENALLTQKNLQASVTHERQMLANEVHDSLAQNLTSMRMRTVLLHDAIERRDDGRAFKYLGEIHDSLAVSHRRVRELITHFRSQMDPRGLVHALNEAGAALEEPGGTEFRFDNRIDQLQLSSEQEMQVFHIAREALANIAKHARARHCRLSLEERRGVFLVTVEDDGVGLAANRDAIADHGHFGLNIMQERAERLGGRIDIDSPGGAGTRIRLSFPVATSHRRQDHE